MGEVVLKPLVELSPSLSLEWGTGMVPWSWQPGGTPLHGGCRLGHFGLKQGVWYRYCLQLVILILLH